MTKLQNHGSTHAWGFYVLTGTTLLLAGFLFLLLLTGFGLFGPFPDRGELSRIYQQRPSRILSADGKEIGTFHLQNRTLVNLDEIHPGMIDALLAIEDIRFYEHNGIDYRALTRVLVKTLLLRQDAGGGSTITQQLVKNLYPRQNHGGILLVTDKLREMMIARKLEQVYSKEQILELYLNTVSFGEDTFGIEMASQRFFNKPPADLTLAESATLAGLLQATTYYNPYRNPEKSVQRRNLVIRQMERYDMISPELSGKLQQDSLHVNYNRRSFSGEMAPYFQKYLRDELEVILRSEPALDENQYTLASDGLTIHTTLDSRLQRAAEEAVAARMKPLQAIFDREQEDQPIFGEDDPDVLRAWQLSGHYNGLVSEGLSEQEIEEILHTPVPTNVLTWDGYEEKIMSPYEEIRYYLTFLNAGFLAIHPETGHVLAWVGGINYAHFPYDQVTARRQPGSAFKPILYAAALESGRTPCDYQRNLLTTFASYDDWTPRNDKDEYGGRYSLQAALAQSINTVAVQVAVETGVSAIQKTAGTMGIHSPMPEAPSIALGTAQVSLLELTAAYTSFLNEGKAAEPQIITRIYNADGELIYDFTGKNSPEIQPVASFPMPLELPSDTTDTTSQTDGISPETAASLVAMLQKAVDEGTGNPLRTRYGIEHALGGKTGTTQQYTDGWFIGFTPEMVFGARVGGANNRVRFRDFPAYGSQTALPIVGHFLTGIAQNDSLPAQPDSFKPHQIDSPYDMQCSDYRNDRLGDRLHDFFTGKSSDEPRVVGEEEEKDKGGNIFQRLGRKLGISGN